MKGIYSLGLILGIIILAYLGIEFGKLNFLFGVIVPYLALSIFICGFIYRIIRWANSPVPFRIPTTCGQQKSLEWIKDAKIENPSTLPGVLCRMASEILLFRSLFRNSKFSLNSNEKINYNSNKWLWLGALAFHWSLFIILTRHLRLVLEPVPLFVDWISGLDSFLQIGLPVLYITDILIIFGLSYLFVRRIIIPQVKYISLLQDFFPLLLILSIGTTGILMRYFYKTDLVRVKELMLSLASFSPTVPQELGVIFYIHLFLVSILFAYFPLSKLMHMGGIFLSPTRNLANNNRMVRHINPWNYPVKVHSYAEYEEEFRKKMKKAGIPVEME